MSPRTDSEPPAPMFAVSGSSGFVGRHLVAHLRQQGRRVRCMSRRAAVPADPEQVQLRNYVDKPALVDALRGCDVLVHLAARAHVLSDHEAAPEQAYRVANHDSAVAIAQAAAEAGVARFVLVSLIGVNGHRTFGRAFTEDDVPAPEEPYAVSKCQAEKAIASALNGTPTRLVVLRPPLVYGADCPGNFRQLLKLVHRLPVIPLGGLRQPRSLIHIDNLCSAIIHAALHPAAVGRTFLLADGVDLSVSDVVRHLARGFGKPSTRVWPVPEFLLRALAAPLGRSHAVDKLAAALAVDASAFATIIGWRPPLTPEEGLARTTRDYLYSQVAA